MNAAMVSDVLDMKITTRAKLQAAGFPLYEGFAFYLFHQSHLDKRPHLARPKSGCINAQLNAFLIGPWTSEGNQMSAIVTELQPKKIPVAGAWFAGRDPLPHSDKANPELTNAECHLSFRNGRADDDIPHLTVQHSGIIVKQTGDIRDGRYTHSDVANTQRNWLTVMDPGIGVIPAHTSSVERTQ